MLFAILLFCITATLAFGMGGQRKAGKAVPEPAEKIPSIQPAVSGLQVKNSTEAASPTQLQGQTGNGSVSQPAAPASAAPNAGLDRGIAASQVQTAGNANANDLSASVSASLQPSSSNAQAQINALGVGVNAQLNLP
jgi:hypothetical protein